MVSLFRSLVYSDSMKIWLKQPRKPQSTGVGRRILVESGYIIPASGKSDPCHGRRRPATHDFCSCQQQSRGWPASAGHDTGESASTRAGITCKLAHYPELSCLYVSLVICLRTDASRWPSRRGRIGIEVSGSQHYRLPVAGGVRAPKPPTQGETDGIDGEYAGGPAPRSPRRDHSCRSGSHAIALPPALDAAAAMADGRRVFYQTVWNVLTGRPRGTGIKDYDLNLFRSR